MDQEQDKRHSIMELRATARVDVVNTTVGGRGAFLGGMAIFITRRMDQSRNTRLLLLWGVSIGVSVWRVNCTATEFFNCPAFEDSMVWQLTEVTLKQGLNQGLNERRVSASHINAWNPYPVKEPKTFQDRHSRRHPQR